MATVTLRRREIIVLAPGSSPQEKSNRKGHLFEQFIAGLLNDYGYQRPRCENLNVTANGIELDVTGSHDLTNEPMIAECKAYSSRRRA